MSRIQRAGTVLVLFLSVLVVFAAPVLAQQPTPSDNEVNRVAKQLFCPVCENTPLDVCPTQACAEWRELIRQKIAIGWSDQQIKDYFAAQYGDRVLSEPPRKGLNWLVYILPALFFLGGLYLVYTVLRRMRRSTTLADAAATATAAARLPDDSSPDPYLKQVEEELKKRN